MASSVSSPLASSARRAAVACAAMGVTTLALIAPAQAAPTATALQCEAHYRDAQISRDKRAYRSARTHLEACASPGCPSVVRKDCGEWLEEVVRATPTVVLEIEGVAPAGVSVTLDGKPIRGALGGASVAVDPGPHRFVVEAPGREAAEKEFIALEGEKLKKLTFALPLPRAASRLAAPQLDAARPPATPELVAGLPKEPGRSLGLPFWISSGVAGSSLTAGGLLFYVGGIQRGYLADQCRSSLGCSEADKDGLRTRLLLADIALGVGVVALTTAVVLFLIAPKTSSSLAHRAMTGLTVTF